MDASSLQSAAATNSIFSPAASTTPAATVSAQRPPLLDVYKKLLIVFKPTDTVVYEDTEGNIKSVPVGEAKLASAPLLPSKPKLNIPVPKIDIVQDYEQNLPPDFVIKPSYFRLAKPTPEEIEQVVDYVADLEDERFVLEQQQLVRTSLKKYNYSGDDNNAKSSDNATTTQPMLTIPLFENMIDILEKATEFETIVRLEEAEKLFNKKIPSFPISSSMVELVYNYWVNKRGKLRKPLLRKYWPVTAIHDTNPHMVFRPREKEKYKLRKKRQNDMDAFRKMQLLRKDFERIRNILDMILRRERLLSKIVDIRQEIFDQQIYDCCNTSGLPRATKLDVKELEALLNVHSNNNNTSFTSTSKRKRESVTTNSSEGFIFELQQQSTAGASSSASLPSFIQPLSTREKIITNWDSAIPYVPNYTEGKVSTISEFKHRGRIGRGGRLCIDRMPAVVSNSSSGNATPRRVTQYVGSGPDGPLYASAASTLLDLIPPHLDYKKTRMKIAEICAQWSDEDTDDYNSNVELVKVADWINTDDQRWGEEKLVIGPL